jgi:hypothetical protein
MFAAIEALPDRLPNEEQRMVALEGIRTNVDQKRTAAGFGALATS